MTWSDLAVGGAFAVGFAFGSVVTARLAGYVLAYLSARLRKRGDPDD